MPLDEIVAKLDEWISSLLKATKNHSTHRVEIFRKTAGGSAKSTRRPLRGHLDIPFLYPDLPTLTWNSPSPSPIY